jgi:hypothetical protein
MYRRSAVSPGERLNHLVQLVQVYGAPSSARLVLLDLTCTKPVNHLTAADTARSANDALIQLNHRGGGNIQLSVFGLDTAKDDYYVKLSSDEQGHAITVGPVAAQGCPRKSKTPTCLVFDIPRW